jgi:hypothetical protein
VDRSMLDRVETPSRRAPVTSENLATFSAVAAI